MQITLSQAEFVSAIHCYLNTQGFDSSRFDISVKIIAGRTDSGSGSRAEVTLEPRASTPAKPVFESMGLDTPEVPTPSFNTPSLFSSED